jgi:hypothetical protein
MSLITSVLLYYGLHNISALSILKQPLPLICIVLFIAPKKLQIMDLNKYIHTPN